jgi:hypothetical protein
VVEIIRSSWECWRQLERAGGLDSKRYDAELVEEISGSLDLDPGKSLRNQLRQKNVSVEDFLSAFFAAVRPYAGMMRDLFVFFERAQAVRSSTGTLQIAFDFGRTIENLEFDLRSFRLWQQVFSITTIDSDEAHYWNHDYLLRLCQTLETAQNATSGIVKGLSDRQALEWLGLYESERIWPAWSLPPPDVGGGDFSDTLAICWQAWARIVSASRSIGIARDDLESYQWESPTGETRGWRDAWLLKLLDGVDWCGRVVRAAYQMAERPEVWETSRSELDRLLSEVPRRPQPREARVETFQELLSLPLWKRRHDLYGAWVGSQIVSALGEGVEILSCGGTLRYAFSGTHLASLRRASGLTMHLWSELRSPLSHPRGKGRKASIQPDYSLQLEPITYPESSRLVVECKQYLRAASRSFADALTDYSRGRRGAKIVLVNYGPVSDHILNYLSSDVRDRSYFIGDFRPGSFQSIAKFFEIVSEVVQADDHRNSERALATPQGSGERGTPTANSEPRAGIAAARNSVEALSIILTWGDQPRDLDLHVWVLNPEQTWTQISYQEKGNSECSPWALLDSDCTNGQGPETVVVFRPTRIRCAVHNFSKDVGLAESSASIKLSASWMDLTLKCPEHGIGDWWDAVEIDMPRKEVQVRERLCEDISLN